MEGLGAEVTQKIKSAIQAKLMELGAYVDDELPDYVMVMVGNKRSKSQMENDLQLFLGNNTVPFTSWLYQVLQKLQEVTVANKNKNVKPTIKKERTPSFEDDDFINIAETDGDILEDELPSKKKQTDKTAKSKSDKPLEKVVYLPTKIKDRKSSEDSVIEKKIDKVNKETNTVVKKRITHDESSSKKSSVNEYVRSNREETNDRKEDTKKRQSSRSPIKERTSDKVVFDARELLNRKKAEKLALKDVSKQNDHVKKKRDHSPDDRHSSKRNVSRVNDADALNRWVNASKDNEQEKNGREKDGGLKSTIHRTSLKRKVSVDDKNDEKSERYKDDKRSDNTRSSKVIRISETIQAEQELIKPRNSSKTVISGLERKSVHSRIAAPNESSRDSDRERERESGVSSVVRITPRPKRPASQQPSSSLILKAVAEANKSLAAAPARPISTSEGDSFGDVSLKTTIAEKTKVNHFDDERRRRTDYEDTKARKSSSVDRSDDDDDDDDKCDSDLDDKNLVITHSDASAMLKKIYLYVQQQNGSRDDMNVIEKWIKYSQKYNIL